MHLRVFIYLLTQICFYLAKMAKTSQDTKIPQMQPLLMPTTMNAAPAVMTTDCSSSRTFTGAEFLVHALASAGVTHVFGGHGGAVVPLVDAIEAHPRIAWVYCRCEVNASQAAAAYAKLHRGRAAGGLATSSAAPRPASRA